MAGRFGWKKSNEEDAERHYLKCACGSRTFFVVYEPVRAKRHTRSGNRFRTAAHCPYCGNTKAVKYGTK